MKSLDHDGRRRLLQQTSLLRLQSAAGKLDPPITAMPVEAKRAARALLRMKPAR